MVIVLILVFLCGTESFGFGSLARSGLRLSSTRTMFSDETTSGQDGGDGFPERQERSLVPQRTDMCRIFVSGVVGTEPKEAYLSHGHYVVNFAVATVGTSLDYSLLS